VGALILGAKRQNPVFPENTSLLTAIGQQIGIAVENARLHNRVKHVTMLEERQRIATEMHDGLAQTLSYLGYKVDRASDFVQARQTGDAILELDRIRNTVDRASTEVRQSIATLQDDPLPRQSLQEWLTTLAAEFDQQPGPPITLALQAESFLFPTDRQLEQILPVVKESLLNASRHAGASQITIYLHQHDQIVTVTVADDGHGFDSDNPPSNSDSHFGLKIMRARAARINGHLKINSEPGRGTNVTLSWHLAAEAEHPPPPNPTPVTSPEGVK
jgi:two-component system nitrate/nitrite sensor histidine kinase NarX